LFILERSLRSKTKIPAGALAIAFCALSCLCGGCQTAHIRNPVIAKYSGSDPDSQLNFWHVLAKRHLTSNDDAFHGILLYADGRDDCTSYDQRVALLKSRGLLYPQFSHTADDAIRRGDLAVIICRVLDIRGGWIMLVFGPVPRYAVRELVYDGIYPPSSPQQTFSGTEFVGVIGKMDDYQQPISADVYSK
jgi:hypothetical protein